MTRRRGTSPRGSCAVAPLVRGELITACGCQELAALSFNQERLWSILILNIKPISLFFTLSDSTRWNEHKYGETLSMGPSCKLRHFFSDLRKVVVGPDL